MSNQKNKPKKQLKNYIQFTGLAFQMGITFYLASYFGNKLDERNAFNKPYFTIVFIIFALVISIYFLIKQLKFINKK